MLATDGKTGHTGCIPGIGLYVGFDTSGTVLKITNEPDDILQYLEISAEMFEKFAEGIENIDDYVVVKKHDYVANFLL